MSQTDGLLGGGGGVAGAVGVGEMGGGVMPRSLRRESSEMAVSVAT